MAKIKMRNARAPSEGVPEPEKVEEEKAATGGTVDVTVTVNGAAEMSQVDRDMIDLISERINSPSIIEQLAAAAGSEARSRIGFGSRILRAGSSPAEQTANPENSWNGIGDLSGLSRRVAAVSRVGSPALQALMNLRQSSNLLAAAAAGGLRPAHNVMVQSEAAHDMIERLSTTTVLNREEATRLVESYRDAYEPFTVAGMNIAIDPGMPGSDMTVVSTGQRSGRSTALQVLQDRLGARQEDAATDPLAGLRRHLLNQYMTQSARALQSEGYEVPHLGGRGLESKRGSARTLEAFFNRHIRDRRWEELSELVFWGNEHYRIAIFLLSGRRGEQMVGLKLHNHSLFMTHDLSENEPQHRRRAWAVGELIGWAQAGARR